MRFKRLFKVLLIKLWTYCIVSIVLIISMSIYIIIFFLIYKKSQNSILLNYLTGLIESLTYSVGVSLIISTLRLMGLKLQLKQLYRTSVFLENKL